MKNNQVSRKSLACLLGLLLVSCLFIFKNFLLGNQVLAYTDIGSDTYDQYLLHYQSIINHIREGNFSLWDFNNGYGVNMFTYNLFDPFLLLIYLSGVLFGAEQIYGILVYWVILHILLAGIAVYLFLSCFPISERAKVFASYIYALCGYMVVWGQHYQFGTVVVLFPLLLTAVEGCFYKRKWYIGITVFCALASLSSLYMAYMQFIVLGFYILFRVAWQEKLFSLSGIKRVVKVYGSMILGIGIGLIQLLPSAYLILNVTGRVNSESFLQRILSMLTLYPDQYYEVLIKRLLSSNALGVNEYAGYMNYYEDPNVFLSALFVIALVQFAYFFFVERYTKKQRMLLALAGGLFGFILLIPLGSAIFNAFAYPFSRHTFLCMPFGVWVMAYVLHKIFEERKCNIPLLVLSVIGVLVCYVGIFFETGKKIPLLLGVLTIGMGVSILGYILISKYKLRELCSLTLLCCLILTMSGDAHLAYDQYRNMLGKSGSEYMEDLYDEDVEQAVSYLKSTDTSFYRIEKDYTVGTDTSCLNSMAQNYRGISTYNSMLNTNVSDWMNNAWPEAMIVNSAHYSFANASDKSLPASLSHVKYVLSKNEAYSAPGYVLLKQFGDIYVYENRNTKDIAKFYTGTISTADYSQIVTSGNQQMLLAEYLVCDSLPEYQEQINKGSVYESEQMNLSGLSEGIFIDNPENDSIITGSANVQESGVLMLAIPYEDGWYAYVDGEEVEIHKVDFGFSGIVLSEGEHEIELRFKCPGFTLGVAGSVFFFLLTVIIWSFVSRRRKQKV